MGADYMTMPFDKLFHTVFTDDGNVRACGRDVCIAFMEAYGTDDRALWVVWQY